MLYAHTTGAGGNPVKSRPCCDMLELWRKGIGWDDEYVAVGLIRALVTSERTRGSRTSLSLFSTFFAVTVSVFGQSLSGFEFVRALELWRNAVLTSTQGSAECRPTRSAFDLQPTFSHSTRVSYFHEIDGTAHVFLVPFFSPSLPSHQIP